VEVAEIDIGRDLIDHRLMDLDGHDVGRVDDLWIRVAHGRAVAEPLVTGAGALFGQFGALGDSLKRAALRLGYRNADRWREFTWSDVHELQRPQVVLVPRAADLAARPEGHDPCDGEFEMEMLYTKLIRLPVVDPGNNQMGVVDVRTTLPEPRPAVLGLLIAPHPFRGTLGMKRYDSTGERFAGTARGTKFLPWQLVADMTATGIRSLGLFADLPLLADAPDAEAPPMPAGADAP
jgi:hypothetical protein